MGFDLAQITSAANRSDVRPGDPQPSLARAGRPHIVSTLQGGGKRGHRVDAETAAGGIGRLMTGADDNDAQGNRLVVMQNIEERVLPALTASAGRSLPDTTETTS